MFKHPATNTPQSALNFRTAVVALQQFLAAPILLSDVVIGNMK